MNRKTAIALIALFTLGTAAKVLGQSPAVEANVPLEFTVGGRLLPADKYTITSSSYDVIEVHGASTGTQAKIVPLQTNQHSERGSELVFRKYGDQYFLHEVLCPTTAMMNVDIPKSKAEKRVQTEAKLGLGEPVLVAAR